LACGTGSRSDRSLLILGIRTASSSRYSAIRTGRTKSAGCFAPQTAAPLFKGFCSETRTRGGLHSRLIPAMRKPSTPLSGLPARDHGRTVNGRVRGAASINPRMAARPGVIWARGSPRSSRDWDASDSVSPPLCRAACMHLSPPSPNSGGSSDPMTRGNTGGASTGTGGSGDGETILQR
jgi:hypothetical protein